MHALVLGWGITGKSVVRYLNRKGAEVMVCADTSEEVPHLVDIEEGLLKKPDLVITSPGIAETHPWVYSCRHHQLPVISDIELGLRSCDKTLLAITGTNGKTTVTLFLEEVLKRKGLRAKAEGNVGTPFLDHADDPDLDIQVVELSSFQIDRTYTAGFSAGIVLNISHDHLDRYGSYHAYASSKCRLGELISPQGKFFVRGDLFLRYPELLHYPHLQTFEWNKESTLQLSKEGIHYKSIEYIFPLGYRDMGKYEVENAAAAYALASTVGTLPEELFPEWETFKRPEHRMELFATLDGVDYYDDSKATNVEAVARAIESLTGPVILIAGGLDKQAPYTPWQESFGDKVDTMLVLGEAADKIKASLQGFCTIKHVADLEEAVLEAKKLAQPGMQVLLSPGCSSYDMFENFAERGKLFKQLVKQTEV